MDNQEEKFNFFGEGGMDPENWEGCREFMKQELAKIFMEAKKSQGISYESIGSKANYSKSQMENCLKGKVWMSVKSRNILKEFLEVQEKTEALKMLERLQRAILQAESPEACEEEISQLLMHLDYEVAEYNQLEAVQEKQLAQMETWFMEMDYQGCYMLDTYYEVYENAQIPELAQEFIRNFSNMTKGDRISLMQYMEKLPVCVGDLHRQITVASKFYQLERLELPAMERAVEKELEQIRDTMVIKYPDWKIEKTGREKHWEGFRKKVKASSYVTGDYFYQWMRYLPCVDSGTWEALVIFLILGDNRKEGLTQWQEFFSKIIPDNKGEKEV